LQEKHNFPQVKNPQSAKRMGNINSKGIKEPTFDAIVIGSGISGGWEAKTKCEPMAPVWFQQELKIRQ